MFGVPTFIRRWGIRFVLVVATASLPIRWLLYLLIDDPLYVLPVQILHSIAMMSLLVVGIIYMDGLLEPKLRASGQALYAAALHGIGPAIGLYVGGMIFGRVGINSVWIFCIVVGLIGTGLLAYASYWRAAPRLISEVSHES